MILIKEKQGDIQYKCKGSSSQLIQPQNGGHYIGDGVNKEQNRKLPKVSANYKFIVNKKYT